MFLGYSSPCSGDPYDSHSNELGGLTACASDPAPERAKAASTSAVGWETLMVQLRIGGSQFDRHPVPNA